LHGHAQTYDQQNYSFLLRRINSEDTQIESNNLEEFCDCTEDADYYTNSIVVDKKMTTAKMVEATQIFKSLLE
jgi:hypothetical protein